MKLNAGTTYWVVVGSALQRSGGKLKFSFDVVGACASNCADPSPERDSDAVAMQTPERPRPVQVEDVHLLCYTLSDRAEGKTFETFDQFRHQKLQLIRSALYCDTADKCALPSAHVADAIGPEGTSAGC